MYAYLQPTYPPSCKPQLTLIFFSPQRNALLPSTSTARREFEDILNALLELSELDEELGGLALELQDSLELAATRAVVKGVLNDSCNWVSTIDVWYASHS